MFDKMPWQDKPIHHREEPTLEAKQAIIKNYCDAILLKSDYTQLPDVDEDMTAKERKDWKQYRKAIRAIRKSDLANPDAVVFPEPPQ